MSLFGKSIEFHTLVSERKNHASFPSTPFRPVFERQASGNFAQEWLFARRLPAVTAKDCLWATENKENRRSNTHLKSTSASGLSWAGTKQRRCIGRLQE